MRRAANGRFRFQVCCFSSGSSIHQLSRRPKCVMSWLREAASLVLSFSSDVSSVAEY